MHSKQYLYIVILLFSISSYAQNHNAWVTAKKGDGIYSLLREQGLDPITFKKEFIALNKASLNNGTSLEVGKSYQLPINQHIDMQKASKKAGYISLDNPASFHIFGKKHLRIESKKPLLKNNVYYLISGHGGPDPGAMETFNNTAISEDEYAYDVTLRLAKELVSYGAKVYLIIRDGNDGIRDQRILALDKDEISYPDKTIPLDQKLRLRQRVEAVNQLYLKHKGQYQRLVVTHVDSSSKSKNIDVFFYHHQKSDQGKQLAKSIHQTFSKNYKKHQPNRAYKGTFSDRDLYLVSKTYPAMAYIEIGNIKNKRDQKRILVPENRQALAKWISEGLLLDYQTSKGKTSKAK